MRDKYDMPVNEIAMPVREIDKWTRTKRRQYILVRILFSCEFGTNGKIRNKLARAIRQSNYYWK